MLKTMLYILFFQISSATLSAGAQPPGEGEEVKVEEMSKQEIGLKRTQEVLGKNGDTLVDNFQKIPPDFTDYIVNFGYGELYARPALSDKNKEFAAVVSLISQGKTGSPLKAHIGAMLNVGWTKDEVIKQPLPEGRGLISKLIIRRF